MADRAAWRRVGYDALAERTRRTATALRAQGVGPGVGVGVLRRTADDAAAALFGVMSVGAVPAILPPPGAVPPGRYAHHVGALLRASQPAVVVVDDDYVPEFEAAAAGQPVRTLTPSDLDAEPSATVTRAPAGPVLQQFTSGSTADPRVVGILGEALDGQMAAIRSWLQLDREAAVASWLPLHHDMGLVGCLLTAVVHQLDLWIMRPEQFLRRPVRYLQALSSARFTAMPAFGLEFVAKRVAPSALDGVDLGGCEAVVVGAERVRPWVLDAFHRLLAPVGLRREALLPAYGLAEATCAVTASPLRRPPTVIEVEPTSLSLGATVATALQGSGTSVVGAGVPMEGVRVRIVDVDGNQAADGVVGEIEVEGVSVCPGTEGTRDDGGERRLHTGDAGFLRGGELFVLGRLGDSVKIRGRTIFAEDLETALSTCRGEARHSAVLLGVEHGAAVAVAVVEGGDETFLVEAEQALRRLTEGLRVVVVDARRGAVARTSSGKVRRRAMWVEYETGGLHREKAMLATAGGHR